MFRGRLGWSAARALPSDGLAHTRAARSGPRALRPRAVPRRAFLAVLLAVPLASIPAFTLAAAPAVAEETPAYTVYELPELAGETSVAHSNGLINADNGMFQIETASDTVAQLPVGIPSTFVEPNGDVFEHRDDSMNGSGEFAGWVSSGPDRGDGAIWAPGKFTLFGAAPAFTSPRSIKFTPCGNAGAGCKTREIHLEQINDSGQVSGSEFYQCGSAEIQCGVAVFGSGGSLQVASGVNDEPTNSCGVSGPGILPFEEYVSYTNSLTNGGHMTGDDCLGGNGTRWGFSAGGTPQLECEERVLLENGHEERRSGPNIESTQEGMLCLPARLQSSTVELEDFNPSRVVVGKTRSASPQAIVGNIGGGGLQSLESLTAKLPLTLSSADHVDDNGDIVGAVHGPKFGETHPYVAIPRSPEPPTVNEVSPSHGPLFGGSHITITGENLEFAREVTFSFPDGRSVGIPITPDNESWEGHHVFVGTPDAEEYLEGAESVTAEISVVAQGGTSPETFASYFKYETPKIVHLENTATGKASSSILGGETLRITGEGFEVPSGDEERVLFEREEDVVGEYEVTPRSDTEIELGTPDLSKLASELEPGDLGVPLEVSVEITTGKEKLDSNTRGYEALVPVVDHVIDTTTDTDTASILGGQTLRITGSGFEVPAGGEAKAVLYYRETSIHDVPLDVDIPVTPNSPTEIELEAPDVSFLGPVLPDEDDEAPIRVEIQISRGGHTVGSPEEAEEEGDVYKAKLPKVKSVSDEETGQPEGSIFGGESTLVIKGSGFEVPEGDEEFVEVYHDEQELAKTPVTPENDGEIQVETPDLTDYRDDVAAGQSALKTEVFIVIVRDDSEAASRTYEVQAEEEEEEEEPATLNDEYNARVPFVSSIVNGATGEADGSILGGAALTIDGSGFQAPEGASEYVEFDEHGEQLTRVPVIPNDDGQIQLTAPDLSGWSDDIPDGKNVLLTDAVVVIEDDGTSIESESAKPDEYEALRPEISAVTDEATGEDRGSILGGQQLTIDGDGFEVPPSGQAYVDFFHGDERLAKVSVKPVGDGKIELTAPDLSAYAGDIPADENGLVTEVVVVIEAHGEQVASDESEEPSDTASRYEALAPKVDSVEDEVNETNAGSIDGGYKLKIKGSAFAVPAGDSADVTIYHEEAALEEIDVEPTGEDEIELTAPDLARYASEIPPGASKLVTDVRVSVHDGEGHMALSALGSGDRFNFLTLAIVSGETATFKIGEAGSFPVQAEGSAPITLSESGPLPEGVHFTDHGNGTATLAGAPAAGTAGEYVLHLHAANGIEPEAAQTFKLTVTGEEPKPHNTSPPTISGSVKKGGTLTCSPGAWTGSPAPTYGYAWLLDGQALAGASSEHLKIAKADLGHTITCQVTASNTAGSAQAASAGTLVPIAGCSDYWIDTAGGDWNTGDDWSAGSPPSVASQTCIIANGTYTVTLPGGGPPVEVQSLTLGGSSGTQSLAVGGGGGCPGAATLNAPAGVTIAAHGQLSLTGAAGCSDAASVGASVSDGGALNVEGPPGAPRTIAGTLADTKLLSLAAGITLNVSAGYTQSAKAKLQSAVGAEGSPGALSVAGSAALAGGKLELEQEAAIAAAPGEAHPLIQATSLTGALSSETGAQISSAGLYYRPTYTPTALTLVVTKVTLNSNPAKGAPGSAVKLTGAGFVPGEQVMPAITVKGAGKSSFPPVTANGEGKFETEITVPLAAGEGNATIEARGSFAGVTVKQAFKVT
jgi:hypothetical protein